MYTLIILFFASLFGIMFMVGRKLAFVRNEQILGREDVLHPFDPHIEKIKHLARRSAKEYSYMALVTTIRIYVKSLNFTKQKLQEAKEKAIEIMKKRRNGGMNTTESIQEDNKFLKKVSEYKQKIREIKHKIKKEEEKNQ
jgi:hypothetical protein